MVSVTESAPHGPYHSKRRARINTKLRSTNTFEETVDTTKDTFFDRNFQDEAEVAWFKFQQAFLTDYQAQLSGIIIYFHSIYSETCL